MENRELAAEGTHSASLSDITIKTAKNSKDFAVLRFQMLGQKASATAPLFLDSAEAFFRAVPGYQGTVLDESQLLGRMAQIAVTHNAGQNGQMFANANLDTIEWEQEPTKPQEPSDVSNKTVILCASHPKNGELRTGQYYYRTIGKAEIYRKETNGKSAYEITVVGIRALLSSAASKKVSLRIFTDVQPAVQGLKQEASDVRCSLHWKKGIELKRLLFRGLRTPYVAKRPSGNILPDSSDELDQLFG